MSDSKSRILARRSAFIAAAALTANCDRCSSHPNPTVCLSVSIQEDAETVRPLVCLSAPPRPCLELIADPDAPPPEAGLSDAGKEGGAITLQPIDINMTDSGKPPPPPMPCLSVALPTTTSPPPRVCLRRLR